MPEKANYLTGKYLRQDIFFKVLIINLQDARYHQSSLYCPDPQYYLIKATAESTHENKNIHEEHENKKIQVT